MVGKRRDETIRKGDEVMGIRNETVGKREVVIQGNK